MAATQQINWINEAVDFLTGLYPVKKEKDFGQIFSQTTELLKTHAHAAACALLRKEDAITVRVVYNAPRNYLYGYAQAEAVQALAAGNAVVFNAAHVFPAGEGEAVVFFPINEGGFTGGMAMAVPQAYVDDELFRQFASYVWVGLRETASLVQQLFRVEELSTRFNAILETVPQGVVFVDDVGKNGWVNRRAAELLNLARDKNKPIAIAEAMHKLRDTAANKEEINKEGARLFSLPGQKITDWKWVFGSPVTSVLSVSCVPTISENIRGRLWLFNDITFAHLANEQLRELNEELAEKRKLADEQNRAKSDFLANMSHEIRTPMNGVIGMASLLVNTELSEEQTEYVETIRISGESLISIINDILDFSKIESGKMELECQPFYLNNVIEETYDLLSVKANEKGLDLLYSVAPDVPAEISGDITRLRQVLINLVSNGIKFTHRGEILVSVKNNGVDEHGVYDIEFTVKDTGIGIPKDKYHRLFASFSQVDSSTTRRYGGTGLGLVICQRLVALMDGSIRVESEEGKGASFIFNIRAEANRRVKQFAHKGSADVLLLKHKKILVLDDNQTNLKILKTQCEMWGMEVAVFDNYEPALAAIQKNKYDVVIIDMLMPVKDGVDVTRIIKQMDSELPVILFSSSGNYPRDSVSYKGLFAAVLNKPTRHSHIQKTILDVLNLGTKQAIEPLTVQRVADADAGISPVNILIAEDVAINQKLLKRALEKLGYAADIVENGKEVLQIIELKKYQLIFMDVMMPEMDGYEATQLIVQQYESALRPVIIATTANALTEDKERALGAGMDDYISKPFRIQDVKEKLDQWMPKILEKL